MKSILLYGAEICIVKQKNESKLITRELDYLRRSARFSRLDEENSITRQNMVKTKYIIQEIEDTQIRSLDISWNERTQP